MNKGLSTFRYPKLKTTQKKLVSDERKLFSSDLKVSLDFITPGN